MAIRFYRRGLTKIKWIVTASNLAAPTLAEINAGVTLDSQYAGSSGFQLKNNPITTPDLGTTFDSQIGGNDSVDASSIDFYDLTDSAAIRTALVKGTAGVVFVAAYGITSGKRSELWPATTTGVNDMLNLDAVAAKYQVSFSITSIPNQLYTIP